MIIPDLPAKSAMLGTDLFAVDDGVHTYKISWSALLAILPTVSNFEADNEEGTLILTLTDGTIKTVTPHDPSKQDALTFDEVPTQSSNNPVKSGGVYNSVKILESAIEDVSESETSTKQDVLKLDERATTAEENIISLSDKMTTAERKISDNDTAIHDEATRAKQAEEYLERHINNLGLKVVNGMLCVVYNV